MDACGSMPTWVETIYGLTALLVGFLLGCISCRVPDDGLESGEETNDA